MGLRNFIDDVRQRKTGFHAEIYDFSKKVRAFQPSYPKFISAILFNERHLRHQVWQYLSNKFYYEQLLKHVCRKTGKNVRTDGDIPLIIGSGEIEIGSHVFLGGRQAWILQKNLHETPRLTIGDNTSINYRTVISVENQVVIGNDCRIAEEVKIFDNNSHSIYYIDRNMKKEDVDPVFIEDHVWIGMNSIILKGVRIGFGSVVAAGSVVTKNVEPLTLVGGNPAKLIKKIEIHAE
jgi:acetyltransferase-like isoleucine patch superfamily enzyme